MSKSGLSNQLLGKMIVPKDWGNEYTSNETNGRIWAGLKPTLSGQMVATIDAAWTQDGQVRLAVHDPWGNTAELSLTLVSLKPE